MGRHQTAQLLPQRGGTQPEGQPHEIHRSVGQHQRSPYFAEIIESIEHHCFAKGYTLILCNSHNETLKQQAYLQMLAQKRVDGLLVMCAEYPEALLRLLEEYRHIPKVVMDWDKVRSDFTDTVVDNPFAGGYMATSYLLDRGHRDIGAITGQLARNTGDGRYRGYLYALKEADILPNQPWIVQGNFEPASGYRAMQHILAQFHRPSAIFCGGDEMATGALCAIHEHGLRVPEDISLIGYDNVNHSRYFTLALTTVDQPKAVLGESALTMLLDRIISKREVAQTIEVHPTLMERCSGLMAPTVTANLAPSMAKPPYLRRC